MTYPRPENAEALPPNVRRRQQAQALAEHPYIKLITPVLALLATVLFTGVGWLVHDAVASRDKIRDVNTEKIEEASTAVVVIQQSVEKIVASVETLADRVIDTRSELSKMRSIHGRMWWRIGDMDTRLTVIETVGGIGRLQ